MISTAQQRAKYVVGDFVSSVVGWTIFNVVRYYIGEKAAYEFSSLESYLTSSMVLLGEVLFPLMLLVVFAISGFYNEVFRKSHVHNFITTLYSSATNTILIFFVALINDVIIEQRGLNYELLLILFSVLFVCTFMVRYIITNASNRKFITGEWHYNALIVGAGSKAVGFTKQLSATDTYLGYNIVGYIPIEKMELDSNEYTIYGFDELELICKEKDIKELIVVPDGDDVVSSMSVISKLYYLGLPIKISPDMYTILVGKMRLFTLRGEPLVDISSCGMSEFEKNIKRICDIVMSLCVLVLLFPLLLIIALLVKCDSKGCIIYKQSRLGYHRKEFIIYKFRTMFENSETDGCPALSSEKDDRITRIGHILRKYRIDELPQFWNVLKGDMSLVGPRPERRFFVEKIVRKAPLYSLLYQVRPGITSMGMVKYGYATSVEEMIERFRYDLLYLENMSVANDIKILIYTIKIVFTGKGI